VRILFSTSHFGFLRNFEFALLELARRGHDLRLVADRSDALGGERTLATLQAACPDRVAVVRGPKVKDTAWQPLGSALRLSLDYWRYLHPRYAAAAKLRARAAAQAPALALRLTRVPGLGGGPGLRAVESAARAVERSLPVAGEVRRFLEEEAPDVLLVTPLLYFGTQQVEYVRAARALGIPSVLGVGSWDHLTTKGLIHEVPDRVIVWNEFQRREAADIHGVDPARVVVTGAQAYDHWFEMAPTLTREEFCARVGLEAGRPYLLYLCSSPFIAPREVEFVERWLEAIRTCSDPALREAGVLVRPHPQNAGQWADVDLSRLGHVAVWPRAGANPVDADTRAEYFHSMHFSRAVIGVNTSGLIESGILGRMVYTILDGSFAPTQEGTLHFRHLQGTNGGLLHTAPDLDAHVAQLADLLAGRVAEDDRARRFVEAFVRPRGLDVPAARLFADAIEAEAQSAPVTASPQPAWMPAWHAALRPAAALARAAAGRRRARARVARAMTDASMRDKDAPAPGEAR
jgi:hypothetical protein